ncbi:hypothetical protein H2200_004105 [Cladophialophora chaetospira]|uniref:FAD/NAD(P)-binding domain-containing protein n=1 Tax=Cladophialophora chaetospira TaxID=386627 RepID=A0AA38XFG8_9EURO|nr:hypothetical protein H2200_004105 [Cladophialophora chaetospira]
MAELTRVIVIGAGIAGLVTAKTYLQVCRRLNRPIELIVLDEAQDPGGVWATERHYPGLMVQAPNGYYELSDLTMIDEEYPFDSLIPAAREHAYLEAYARKFDVLDKIRFSTKVARVRRRGAPSKPGWTVETAAGELLECDKLIVASGLYSQDRPIPVPYSRYTGTAIHSRYLHREHERLCSDPNVKDVVVIGACKSSVETCSVFLAAKKRVHWVVRPSDQGAPLLIFHPDQKPTPLAIALARLFPIFTPSIWSTTGFWYNFMHSGYWVLGTWLVHGFFKLMSWVIMRDVNYGKSQNSLKIQPKRKNLFFYTTYLSLVLDRAPFLDALHEDNPEKLTVYRATPLNCEGRELVVDEEDKGERRIPADAVVWSIGWDPGLAFFDPEEAAIIGLPVPLNSMENPSTASKTTTPIVNGTTPADPALPPLQYYDSKVRKLFPGTLNQTPAQPQDPTTTLSHTRWGLYRFNIPAKHFANNDRTLAFSGMISSGQTVTTSEIGALWAVAWLEDLFTSTPMPLLKSPEADRLRVPSPWASKPSSKSKPEDNMSPNELNRLATAEILFNQAFQERRYGLRGARSPELIMEARSYIDLLCYDLGVEVYRKRYRMRERNTGEEIQGGWWAGVKNWAREYFEPYLAGDYKGVVDEFLRNREEVLKRR